MSNYYEFLNLQPTATATEIRAATDNLYNHWRKLITHHDAEKVDLAQRELRKIEHIRTTLLDPKKRTEYDAEIVDNKVVGGLADPATKSSREQKDYPTPRSLRKPAALESRIDAWVCPECSAPSPIGTKHCQACGKLLGKPCPNCSERIFTNAKFCQICGTDIHVFLNELVNELEVQDLKRVQANEAYLENAQQLINQKKWRIAQEFLGKHDEVISPFAPDPQKLHILHEWGLDYTINTHDPLRAAQREALLKSTRTVKKERARTLIVLCLLVYTGIGIFGAFGYLVYTYLDFGRLDSETFLIAFAILLATPILAGISSALYSNFLSGKSNPRTEEIFALLSPIGLAMGAGLVWVAIIVILVLVVLGFLSGG